MRKKVKKILLVTFLVLIGFYFLIVHLLIFNTSKQVPPENTDYLVILGARLHGERMSLALQYRVEAALEYLQENPSTKVIVAGGQGPGENITEAEAMSRYFLDRGIEQDRIVLENKSTSTYENLLFSRKLIKQNDQVVIVSNDFHLFRASMIAERVGFQRVDTLPAKTPTVVIVKLWTREYLAVLKTWLFDR
jgi:uncharacterized SAM-binding protein YcdF (DUF218 family)